MKDDLLFSIIIPVKEINDYIRKETILAILKQSYQNFEIIILPDKATKERFPKTKVKPTWPKTGPADKRDLGAKNAKGQILVFLDDDSYPQKEWLMRAKKVFEESKKITGVCGPALTPPHNNIRQKASGYVWSTWLGSGGAGTYRCAKSTRREVDDFPTVNLLIRKKDFWAAGGFDSHFWPGEDTKLCLDLTKKLGKKIIYDPDVLVHHHRREVFGPHLQQISRYAVHRGHFARIFPKTSFRLGYLAPTLFVSGLILGLLLLNLHPVFKLVYILSIMVYFLILSLTAIFVFRKEKDYRLAILVAISIFVTHITYGILFLKGFFTSKLER